MRVIAAERLSEIIGQIYDCVLEPEKWDVALGSICRELNFLNAVLGYYDTRTGQPLLRVQYGMSREWFDKMPLYSADSAAYWGGNERIVSYPLGEVIAHSIASSDVDISRNRFAQEWCAPQGIAELIGMTVALDRSGLGSLVFTKAEKVDPSQDGQLELLRLLSPHVRRVVAISKLLDLKTIEAASFEATLEVMANGVLLLDSEARVIHANAAAERSLRARDAIYVTDGRLTLRDNDAMKALSSAIAKSASAGKLGPSGLGVPARGQSGLGVILHVLPLEHLALRCSFEARAVAAVFVTTAQSRPRLPADALALLYDLTPAEIRTCELIVEGLSPGNIAQRIGVAPSTARSHLLRVFEKTGTNRQADLVRLCGSFSIPA